MNIEKPSLTVQLAKLTFEIEYLECIGVISPIEAEVINKQIDQIIQGEGILPESVFDLPEQKHFINSLEI